MTRIDDIHDPTELASIADAIDRLARCRAAYELRRLARHAVYGAVPITAIERAAQHLEDPQ